MQGQTSHINTSSEIDEIEHFLRSYYRSFEKNGQIPYYLTLKYHHMLRVARNTYRISSTLTNNKTIINNAYICGLLHDSGRFTQLSKYGTFKDSESLDHALLSLQVIQAYKLLDFLPKEEKAQISFAIENHNKKTIEQPTSREASTLARIIRDADKADIYYVMTSYYEDRITDEDKKIQLGLNDTDYYNPKHIRTLFEHQMLDLNAVENLNELKLLQLGWLFDINYRETLLMIRANQYIEKIFKHLPNNSRIRSLEKDLCQYLDDKTLSKNHNPL